MISKCLRTIFVLVTATIVAACATTPGHQLSLAEVQALSYTETEVRIPESARINWGRYQREQNRIAEGKPLDGSTLESANKKRDGDANFAYTALFPSAEQHKDDMLVQPIKESFKTSMDALMAGDREVKGIVEVNAVVIINAAQSLLVGGANQINASFRLVDVGTNATLATLPLTTVAQSKGSGELGLLLNELGKRNKYERTASSYAATVSKWLEEKGEK